MSNLGSFTSGSGFPEKYQGNTSLDVPFYKVSDMNLPRNTKYMLDVNNTVDDSIIKQLRTRTIDTPSIIFAKVGAAIFGERKRIVKHRFLIDNNMMAFTPNNKIDLEFCHACFYRTKLSHYTQIGALPSYNASDLSIINFGVPSMEEQRKIAKFVILMDNKIEKHARLVELLKKYKRGLMQAIFSREVQLENSSNWEHRLFSEIASLGKGKYTPKQEKALPCIELEHLEQQTGQIIGYANSNEQNSVKSVFHKGDVLFGKLRPYLRKFALPEYDGVCSSEIWVLHPKSNIDSTFLFYLIQSESFIAAANISSGTKMPRAEWSKVSNEGFFIPELSEQKRIADLFSAIDKRIVNATRTVNKMQSLKQGLLQQLFI